MPEKATNGELLLKITYNYKKDRFTESSSQFTQIIKLSTLSIKRKERFDMKMGSSTTFSSLNPWLAYISNLYSVTCQFF